MSGYTKGPWEYSPAMIKSADDEIVSGNHAVAIIKNHLNPADANLIAAAPDLLEALENLFACDMAYFLRRQGGNYQIEAIAQAKAAIAKAKGEHS